MVVRDAARGVGHGGKRAVGRVAVGHAAARRILHPVDPAVGTPRDVDVPARARLVGHALHLPGGVVRNGDGVAEFVRHHRKAAVLVEVVDAAASLGGEVEAAVAVADEDVAAAGGRLEGSRQAVDREPELLAAREKDVDGRRRQARARDVIREPDPRFEARRPAHAVRTGGVVRAEVPP